MLSAHGFRPGLYLLAMFGSAFVASCTDGYAGPNPDTIPEVLISTADLHFNAPNTVPAGLTRIRLTNTSTEWHHVQLIRIEDGRTFEEFEKAVSAGAFSEPWMTDVGGPNVPPDGGESDVMLDLKPGVYGMICFIPGSEGVSHVMQGMVRMLTVVPGEGVRMPEPAFDAKMALDDYEFTITPEITAGRRTIRVENVAEQSHEVVVARLAPGRTVDDVLAYLANMNGPLPGELVGGTTAMARGHVNYMTIDFTSGEYVLLCFAHDAEDGKSHVQHGMYRQFSVL